MTSDTQTQTPSFNEHDTSFSSAIQSVRQTLEAVRGCSPEEKDRLREQERQLEELLDKLHQGRVEIVVFGEISTGKSALVNALAGEKLAEVDVRGGWTREVSRATWQEYRIPGFDRSSVVLVDTPGLNEVDGQARAEMARRAAEVADLILFVTDSDLNEVEYQSILELRRLAKPMIVVLNKEDLFTREQRDRLLHVLRHERLADILPPEMVVPAAADPREQEYIIQRPDGTEYTEWRKPAPNVAELKARIMEILDREGLALVALSAAMFARDTSDQVVRLRMHFRNAKANEVIFRMAALKGVLVAGIPTPLLDVAGGVTTDTAMVLTLAGVYGISLNRAQAAGLLTSIAGSTGLVVGTEYLIHLASGVWKTLTFGWGAYVTLVPQAVAAAFGSYLVGHAAKYYLEHGASWGDQDPRQVIRRILASIDRKSVLAQLKDEILKTLGRRPKVVEGAP